MARRSGQIIRRGDRKWLVRWYAGVDEQGKRRYASRIVHGTKRDAQKLLNQVLRSRDLGTYVEPTKLTLNAFLDRWLETAQQRLAPRTADDYRWILKRYVRPRLGSVRLDQLRALDVQGLVNELTEQLSPRTVRLAHAVLAASLKQAVKWGLLAASPAALVDLPRQQHREMQALTPEQVATFRDAAAGDRYAVLFDFLLGTGCRPGEALALRWADLDLEAGRAMIRQALTRQNGKLAIKQPKTPGSRRTIPLPRSLVAALRDHRRAQAEHALRLGSAYDRELDLVFANAAGDPVNAKNVVRRHFKPVLKAAGLPASIRLYDLRHTHATALLAQGVHPKVAAERLGHSTTRQTLDTYSHVLPSMQEEAAARLEATLFSPRTQ